jgi:hypothetical protein
MDEQEAIKEIEKLHRIIDVLVSKLREHGVLVETKEELEKEAG